jgi:hypothetical protein
MMATFFENCLHIVIADPYDAVDPIQDDKMCMLTCRRRKER